MLDTLCGFDLYFLDDSYVEHLFMCVFIIYVSSLEKCLFRSFACSKSGYFCYFRNSLDILDLNSLSNIWLGNLFSPFCELPSHSVDIVLWYTDVFSFHEVQFVYIFFCCLCFLYHIHKNIAKYHDVKLFLCVFFWRVLWFLTLRFFWSMLA